MTAKQEKSIRAEMKKLFKHTFSGKLLQKAIDDAITAIKERK